MMRSRLFRRRLRKPPQVTMRQYVEDRTEVLKNYGIPEKEARNIAFELEILVQEERNDSRGNV